MKVLINQNLDSQCSVCFVCTGLWNLSVFLYITRFTVMLQAFSYKLALFTFSDTHPTLYWNYFAL